MVWVAESAEGTCQDAILAAVEEHCLPNVPVHVHHMEIFYHPAAESDRELLKLQILGYVQTE